MTPICLERNISKTTGARDFKFDTRLCMGIGQCRAGAQIIFPDSGRGLGHVAPTIFGSMVGYPSDSLASCYAVATLHIRYTFFTRKIATSVLHGVLKNRSFRF